MASDGTLNGWLFTEGNAPAGSRVHSVVVRPLLAVTVVTAAVLAVPTALPATTAVAATPAGSNAAAVMAGLSQAQRVGQLLMVSASLSGVSQTTKDAITRYHVGSVILAGRSSAGVSEIRRMTNGLQQLATAPATGGVPLFVATDQEGGQVQTLSGPGFSTIPTAVRQGTFSTTTLRNDWVRWAGQLAAAGVNLDLAPVLDTVPPGSTSTNQPIGRYQREYGTNPSTVKAAGLSVVRGMHAGGIEATVKHFPGLGRASGNTDTTFGVVDNVTTRHDAYIAPFAAATRTADAGVVMVSLATYKKIDGRRAVFSPTVIGGMLRHDLGFTGVVISDAMNAVALRDVSPGQRAVRFVDAGGDLALTDKPSDIKAMASALLSRAQSDTKFRAKVNAACLRVLIAKQRLGLLAGALAAAADSTRLYLAEQTTTHHVSLAVRDAGGWGAPVDLGGGSAHAPGLAALPGGGVEVARVTRSGAVAVRSYVPGGSATSWQSLGGSAVSSAAVAVAGDGRMAVVAVFSDGKLHVRNFTPGRGWGSWSGLGGSFIDAAPALVFLPSGDLAAYAVGPTQSVYRKTRHAGSWSGWSSVGGLADSGVAAVVAGGGDVSLLIRSSNETLRTAVVGVTRWSTVGGARPAGTPAAAQTAPGVLTVVLEGSDGKLHLATRSGATWSTWSALPFD